MNERYAPIRIKGAVCVVVLLITVWDMTATSGATTGESLTPFQLVVIGQTTMIANSELAS